MNSIKLFLLSFKKNIFSFILVILQISALLLAENYMVCVINEREMLNIPFYPLLNENTVFVYDANGMFNASSNFNESRRHLLEENVSGEYKIYDVIHYTDGRNTVLSVSDEIYEKLALPLSSGSYGNKESGAVGTIYAEKGEHIFYFDDGTSFTLNVCGNLTELTYLTVMNNFKSSEMTVSDLYENSIDGKNTILTSRSAIKGYEERFRYSLGFLIEFRDNAKENIANLQGKSMVITAEKMLKNTSEALASDRVRFLPLIGCIAFIVLIGIICVSVITFKENERKNGIMWLCGYSRAGIIGVHLANILLITLISAGVSMLAYAILKFIGNRIVVGLNLSFGNLIITLLTLAVLVGVSAIIPALKCRKSSPVEYLRRAE